MSDTRPWHWSWHGPDGPFHGPCPSRAAALAEALRHTPPQAGPLYVCRGAPVLASTYLPDLDTLLQATRHEAAAQHGSRADGWLAHVTDAEHQDLLDRVARAIDGWACAHDRQPGFFHPGEVEQIGAHAHAPARSG